MSTDITGFLNTNSARNPQIGDYLYILRSGSNWYYCDQNGGIINSDYMYASGEANSGDFYITLTSYNISNTKTTQMYLHPNGEGYTGTTILSQNNTTFYDTIMNSRDIIDYTVDFSTSNTYYKITFLSSGMSSNLGLFFDVEPITASGGEGGGGGNSIAPCFSQETLLKLFPLLPKNKFYLMTRMKREDKKMYSINYGSFENLDFTSDHQFIYKNKVYTFENLIKIHPLFKRAIEKPPQPDEYIYNIYGSFDKKYSNIAVEIGPNLFMMGGKLFNNTDEYFKETKEKIKNIKEQENLINFTIDKFINSGINSDMIHLVFVPQS